MPGDAQAESALVARPRRRWHQFTIVSLLGMVLAVAIGLALVVNPAARQRRGVEFVHELGGRVSYTNRSSAPVWLRGALGDDYFETVSTSTCAASGWAMRTSNGWKTWRE